MKNRLTFLHGKLLTLSAALVLAIVVVCSWQSHAISANARQEAGTRHLNAEAKKAVEAWAHAVASGNVETVRKYLAPEFQILRSDGKAYDAKQYLAGGMSKIKSVISVKDVVATAHDNLMVVRYVISLKASADGAAMQQSAPRLTVFRRKGDHWLVVAHANFARLRK